jgi:hypothetical protein
LVLRDDRARSLERHLRVQGGDFVVALPAVVEILFFDDLETAGGVRGGAAPAPGVEGREAVAEVGAELARDHCALLVVDETGLR